MGQLQRIQSVYLFLASLIGSSLFVLPFASGPTNPQGLLSDGYLNINDNIGLIILTVLVIVLSLGTIFLYNNRVLQKYPDYDRFISFCSLFVLYRSIYCNYWWRSVYANIVIDICCFSQ